MALGECIKQDFVLIKNAPDEEIELNLPERLKNDCCFEMLVLATLAGSDYFTNDQSSVLFFYNQTFTGAAMELEKFESGAWVKKEDLNDDSFGTFYDFGFFVNQDGESLLGYRINWQDVLNAHGEGSFRVKTIESKIIGADSNRYSFQYCLQKYNPHRADYTIRIDWNVNGIIGDDKSRTARKDYGGLNWFNQLRLKESVFGFDSAPFEKEYVRYQTGQQVWLKDEHLEEYVLKIGRIPYELHRFILSNVLHGDNIKITDYNSGNPAKHIETPVVHSGNYESPIEMFTELTSVQLDFQQEFINNDHKRC